LPRLHAIRAGVHSERPSNATGDAVIEMEPADGGLMGNSREPLVRRGGARTDPGIRNGFHLAKSFGRQANHEPLNAAFANQKVGTDADDGYRYLLRDGAQECRQILLIHRLKQRIRRPACPEPGDLLHLCVGCNAPAHFPQSPVQLGEKVSASDHTGSPPSSFGRA
jgi:hypothetical protein